MEIPGQISAEIDNDEIVVDTRSCSRFGTSAALEADALPAPVRDDGRADRPAMGEGGETSGETRTGRPLPSKRVTLSLRDLRHYIYNYKYSRGVADRLIPSTKHGTVIG